MNDQSVPLCVEFDGALTPVNTADERLLALLKHSPYSLLKLFGWTSAGKSALWHEAAVHAELDPASLPVRQDLIDWLRQQRSGGRRVVLLVSGDLDAARQFAAHLDLFDEIVVVEDGDQPAARRKLDTLLKRFGEHCFDFVSSDPRSAPIWSASRQLILVGTPVLAKRIGESVEIARVFSIPRSSWRAWLEAMRIHQWVKNTLIFIPALLAHDIFAAPILGHELLAFLAFSLCASSVYLLNDLFDLTADRHHPRKRQRPFAAGVLSARAGFAVSILLLAASVVVALSVNLNFLAALAGYYVMTWAYSMRLKRVALLDVMMLAGLYTTRIIAGAAATGVPLSFWLLAFSVFLFLSLGYVKRYAELEAARRAGHPDRSGRGYGAGDLPLIMSLGTASGYCAVVVIALYINSSDSQALYRHHKPLWLICPIMLFWISRVWTKTARGSMHDDPVVFALRDRVSVVILLLLALIIVLAS